MPSLPAPITWSKWKEILRNESLPVVVVDLDAFDRNISRLADFVRVDSTVPKKTLRLATKSVRVPALIERALAAGSPYKGLMCFAAEEAAYLASQGFDDLLVAYPTVQDSDLKILREIHERGTKIALICDGVEGVRRVALAMQALPEKRLASFRLVIDVDASLKLFGGLVHLGVRRSPIHSTDDVARLLDEIAKHPQLTCVGAMGYEAQVAGLGDRNPFKKWMNPVFALVRKLSVRAVAKQRAAIAEVFRKKGLTMEIFNGGGTGSMNFSAKEPWLTELSAGSALLSSHLFDYYSNVRFEPACFFALQITRIPAPGYVTCLGGGYVASGEPGWDKVPLPYAPEGARLLSDEACGEVQTPLRIPGSADLALGDPVLFRHAKAGELAERFNEYLLVSGGRVVSRAKTYRGLGLSFF